MLLADVVDPGKATPLIHINVQVLAFIAGTIVPFLTAFLTKLNTTSRLKAWCTALLSIVGGVVAYLVSHDGSASVGELASVVIATYVYANVTYHGTTKPSGAVAKVAGVAPNFGLGKAA